MAPLDKQDIVNFLSAQTITAKRKEGALALALASPSYQWY
jgi:hypothetical protein